LTRLDRYLIEQAAMLFSSWSNVMKYVGLVVAASISLAAGRYVAQAQDPAELLINGGMRETT